MSTPDQQRGEKRHGRSNKVNARNVIRRNGHSYHNITPNISTRSENNRNGSVSSEKSEPPCRAARCLETCDGSPACSRSSLNAEIQT